MKHTIRVVRVQTNRSRSKRLINCQLNKKLEIEKKGFEAKLNEKLNNKGPSASKYLN
jgi:hypothetical protein